MHVGSRGVSRVGFVCLGLITALVASTLSLSHAADPDPAAREKYQSLFATKEKSVAATAATRDDAQFAAELMKAAGALKDDPELMRVLSEKAFEYGAKDPDGYAPAVAAGQRLKELGAGSDWDARLVELHRAQYKRAKGAQKREAGLALLAALRGSGDAQAAAHRYVEAIATYKEAQGIGSTLRDPDVGEIKELIKRATDRKASLEKIEKIKSQAGTDAAKLNAVAMGYLLDLDDPQSAGEFAVNGSDADAKAMIPLAVKPSADLAESELLKLGDWYAKLSPAGPAARRFVALTRAERYFKAFLETHTSEDGERLQATARMEAISKELLDLAGSTGAYTADRLVVWNTHNGPEKDRGAKTINVVLISRGESVWSKRGIKIPWSADLDTNVAVPLPRVLFDSVRVEVIDWHGFGGGLAEIEVYRGSKNLARGGKVTASSQYNPAFCFPSNVTDGVTSATKMYEGYWVLPDKAAGWVEVQMGK